MAWMRWARRHWIGLGLAALAGLLTAMWWGAPSGSQTVRLADGRQVTLKAVTFGKTHRYTHAKPWLKPLALLLPANWAARLGAKTFEQTTATEVLMCWFETRPMPRGRVPFMASVVDEDGDEWGSLPCVFDAALPAEDRTCFMFMLSNFPRRVPQFRLHLFDSFPIIFGNPTNVMFSRVSGSVPASRSASHWTNLVMFTIPNPVRGPFPAWTPEPLPITRQDEEGAVTLTAFNTGLYATGLLAETEGPCWTELAFQFPPDEQCAGPWIVSSVERQDATGNSVRGKKPYGRLISLPDPRHDMMERRNAGGISLPGAVWHDEPAWKLRVEFVQDRNSQFRSNDLWEVKGVAVPPSNGMVELDLKARLRYGALRLKGITAANVLFPGERTPKNPSPQVYVELEPATNGVRLDLIRAIDNRGEQVVSYSTAQWGPPASTSTATGISTRAFGLFIPPEARALDLTFALYRSRTVEFLAKPALLRTNILKAPQEEDLKMVPKLRP